MYKIEIKRYSKGYFKQDSTINMFLRWNKKNAKNRRKTQFYIKEFNFNNFNFQWQYN